MALDVGVDSTASTHRSGRSGFVVGAAAVSSLGDGMMVSGLPLLASGLTDKSWLVTGVYAAGRIPWLLSPLIGAAVDLDGRPRRVMISADLVRFFALLILGISVSVGGGIAVVCVTAALLSLGEIAFASASWTMVRHSTRPEDLDRRNSHLNSAQTMGEHLVGPTVGGLLFAWGASIPLFGNALSFIVSALLLRNAPAVSTPVVSQPLRQTLREGLETSRATPAIWVTTLWVATIVFFHTMVVAGFVLINRDYGFGNATFTVSLLGMAVGNLGGAWLAPRLIDRLGSVEVLIIGTLTSGLMHLLAATSTEGWLLIASLGLDGIGVVVGSIAALGMRQRNAPPHLVGAVMATSRMVGAAAALVGSLIAGFLIQATSGRFVMGGAGLGITLLACFGARPLRRRITRDSNFTVAS
jgi:MFS family permease